MVWIFNDHEVWIVPNGLEKVGGHKRGLVRQIQTLARVEISTVSKRGTGLCDRLTDTIVKDPGLEVGTFCMRGLLR